MYKVGDRVRRTPYKVSMVKAGTLGEVTAVDYDGVVWVMWPGTHLAYTEHTLESLEHYEPLPTVSVGMCDSAPAPLPNVGYSSEYRKAAVEMMKEATVERQIAVDIVLSDDTELARVTKVVESAISGFSKAHALGISKVEVRADPYNAMVMIEGSERSDGSKWAAMCFSKCHHTDKPNLMVGVTLAMRRAMAAAKD